MIEPGHGLTTEEAAHVLGVKVKSVYMDVFRGNLPRHGVRGRDFDRAEVERLSLSRWDMKSDHPYWLTAQDAAELLGQSPGRVRERALAGDLPCERHPNGRLVFRRHQIDVIGNARESKAWRG